MSDPWDERYDAGRAAGERQSRADITRRMKNGELPVGRDALLGVLHTEALRLGLDMKVYPNGEAIDDKPKIIKPSREGVLQGLRMGVFAREEGDDQKGGLAFLKEKAYPIARDGEWFDFGTVNLQRGHSDWRPFAEQGLIDLPYPRTSFRARLAYELEGRTGNFETIWIGEQEALGRPITLLCLTLRPDKDEMPLMLTSIKTYAKGTLQAHKLLPPERIDQLFFALWMILNTRGVENRVVQPDEKLNRARQKNGKDALRPYTVVDTQAYITALRETERMEAEGGTHASPRPHLRRAHLRHLAAGKIVPVMACIVNGSSSLAIAVRDKYSVEKKP